MMSPQGGILVEDDPPDRVKLPWPWNQVEREDLHSRALEREGAHEGEGEGVRGRGSGVREGESAGEGKRKKWSIYYICGTRMTKLGK